MILRGQAWIATQGQKDGSRRILHAVHIGRRQRRVELLIGHIRAAEEFAAIGGRNDLELVRLSEMRAGCAVGVDDALGEQVLHGFSVVFWNVGRVDMVEATVFTNDDDDVFDWASGFKLNNSIAGSVVAVAGRDIGQHRKCKCRRA